ncbi:MAG: YabP/YqfC family sporulation protein [Ruminococcus sp.]|nr:YabP/YqfC family sporulation protein [Ruminococcus sp.]
MQKNNQNNTPIGIDMGGMPVIEMLGNRRITLEGSTGILLYESENIKINTRKMVVSFCGRGLCVRCISSSCVEIEGFVTKIEFLT